MEITGKEKKNIKKKENKNSKREKQIFEMKEKIKIKNKYLK